MNTFCRGREGPFLAECGRWLRFAAEGAKQAGGSTPV